MVQRRGVLLRALFRISEGFFFGPHHLIMAVLLYFEEKVHRKKLLKVDAIPLLFPGLLCQILEHLGYPSEPQLERRCICQEIFILDKWTSMTTYDAELGAPVGPEHPEIPHPEHLEEPQPVEMPAPAIQHHLGILLTPEHTIPIPLEPTDPSQAPPLAEQTMPPEEPTTGEIEAFIHSISTSTAEPSSSHDPPTTI
ncbi:hypothetical protein CK203_110618 [Vitis vinifera]|uniref:Uncharacterized protein n=1 Tax=Vitis vinifera TaxID=29760 RepID=A0A438CAZ5_VITVI|nr:hypothetical protein CK203_110618 [Vitis vinifera]